ncbi:hydroxyacylglutathione hydrolase [Serratia microhaemolytica]|uniref:hydroxyacylglutathione hydrolase n=1 Tax=Serratia microhaemolytica TaxID=2675110 RepID=UPI000FDCF81A|nr:hydroxyacylglutathione hydrolase [Serratia microhaemolytica]
MALITIAALRDNYIWLLSQQQQCVIIDPGDASAVLAKLEQLQLTPVAILLTHHHADHGDGVSAIVKHYPGLPLYGPAETAHYGTDYLLNDGDIFQLVGRTFTTFAVPGHTAGHLAFYSAPYLFCGDVLFSAGCGRVFEGTPQQMHHSLQRLAQLPDETLICCAHEYTLANLAFARMLLPEDQQILDYQQQVEQLRAKKQPSVPTTLQLERKINLFLRCNDIDLQKKIGVFSPPEPLHTVFAALRRFKDNL